MAKVRVDARDVIIPTYPVEKPEKNPFFLEKRVFQGSSGKTYPLPFYSRVSEEKTDQTWRAVFIENDYLEVMLLPQIGGRIHAARDKTNGYDFIYRQEVIKPALVGLAGPWISGGIEFNWPQHHRPGTYMPTAYEIEEHEDGSVTVWMSDHDPLQRMKGMHGVCLYPDRAYIELKVRAYNRTEYTQTFLWWANIATRVHEQYQSFFPPDVHMVADHAKRALSTFPLCSDKYYGVDYAGRAKNGVPEADIPAKFVPPHCRENGEEVEYQANDLSWYANIPVPTSYMCIGSAGDFCGGYDHREKAGIIHVADHNISPGKKQWTWGNQEFGYAWDRNLCDDSEPYIELMAGVYTDNQPDFSYLMPGETKTWSQYFYPFSGIGPVQYADRNFALNMRVSADEASIGIAATAEYADLKVELIAGDKTAWSQVARVAPGEPFITRVSIKDLQESQNLVLTVSDASVVMAYLNSDAGEGEVGTPETATEPPAPEDIDSSDELYITGLHLEQYRHATRSPEIYWQEALRRDSEDARCNTAMGKRCFARGELTLAEEYLMRAIKRLTRRNPNPADGEAYYYLGLALRLGGKQDQAYAVFYKSAWNMAWCAPAYQALAEIDCCRGEWRRAEEHLRYALKYNSDNLRARNLLTMVLLELGEEKKAADILQETCSLDKLDVWSRYLSGKRCLADSQGRVDLAIDLARAGFYERAIEVLFITAPEPDSGTAPMLFYLAAWFRDSLEDAEDAGKLRNKAKNADMSYCFPSRLEEMLALEAALAADATDPRAAYYLGNLYYDRLRHEEAIVCWEMAVKHESGNAVAWRNIGIGAFNSRHDLELSLRAYEQAVSLSPADSRLLYERDMLWKRAGRTPKQRLEALEARSEILRKRDDLLLEYCSLLNLCDMPEKAAEYLYSHKFQPWEGGEGLALSVHVRLNLLQAQKAFLGEDYGKACDLLKQALTSPENLGEAKHLLVNQSDIYYWLGLAYAGRGDEEQAGRYWRVAAQTRGDFQTMEVKEFSEMSCYSALALQRLGHEGEAEKLLSSLGDYALRLMQEEAKIDYFATSLPNMLLFEEDLNESQRLKALLMQAQARYGLGDRSMAERLCREIIEQDPGHIGANDFIKMLAL